MEVGLPSLAAVLGLGVLGLWARSYAAPADVRPRPFGNEVRPPVAKSPVPVAVGNVSTPAPVVASNIAPPPLLPGEWPSFRGAKRDDIADSKVPSGVSGLKMLWSVPLGEGYAGPAVKNGRVYVLDYDMTARQDVLRCLSLADGKELWHNGYPSVVKRNHGMSRTVPATDGKVVVSLGPKCQVLCADAVTGRTKWTLDLVKEFGATVPNWYAGQCPLIDGNKVVLAPSGPSCLMMAVDLATGKPLWKTPNPRGWTMTHSSIAPTDGQYVYCGSGGVAGVSAKDGKILWDSTEWVVSTATVPTPVPVGGRKLFLCGGYNAGAMMLQTSPSRAKVLWKVDSSVFGSDQQTPVFYKGYLYGVAPGGELVCLSLDGKRVWSSGHRARFGLGPYFIADGKIVLLNDSGVLTLAEAGTGGYKELGKIRILKEGESWGPMALVGDRLLARDLTTMVCVQMGGG